MNPGGQWYYLDGNESRGPVSQQQLLDLVRGGRIPPGTMVAGAGWQQWQPAKAVFADLLAAPPPAPATPPAPAVQQAPQPQPQQPKPMAAAPVPTAIGAVQLRCISGPDNGKVFVISAQEVTLGRVAGIGQQDPSVADHHVMLSWSNNMLNFRTGPHGSININGMTPSQGALMLGQTFTIGASTWQVSNQSFTLGGLLDSVGSRLNSLASTEKLEAFSLSGVLTQPFKKCAQKDVDE